jgi:hypothetical protein
VGPALLRRFPAVVDDPHPAHVGDGRCPPHPQAEVEAARAAVAVRADAATAAISILGNFIIVSPRLRGMIQRGNRAVPQLRRPKNLVSKKNRVELRRRAEGCKSGLAYPVVPGNLPGNLRLFTISL